VPSVILANHHHVDPTAYVALWITQAFALAYPTFNGWLAHQTVVLSALLVPNALLIWHVSRINVATLVVHCAVPMRDAKRSITIPYARAHPVLLVIHSLPALKCHVRIIENRKSSKLKLWNKLIMKAKKYFFQFRIFSSKKFFSYIFCFEIK